MFNKCLKYLVLFVILESLTPHTGNTQIIDRDLLIEDVRQLASILESSHPDPYIKGGGKIAFHRRLHELMLSIPQDGIEKDEFQKLLSPFVAAVGDGHTRIHVEYKQGKKQPGGIPLYFSIIGKSLYVSKVVERKHQDLMGSLLVSVENVGFKELSDRVGKLRGTDNEYGKLTLLAGEKFLWYESPLAELLPEWRKGDITVELKLPNGKIKNISFSIPFELNEPLIGVQSLIELPSTKNCEFAYDFLDEKRKTAILKVDGMGGFRENFELVGLDGEFSLNGARYFYQRYNEEDPPDDKPALINGIPSATETFKSLVTQMKRHGTETLMIDIRENGGGNSALVNILTYYLYGIDSLISLQTKRSGFEIIKYSDLYFDQVEDAKKGTNHIGIELGNRDYWFEELYELDRFEYSNIQKVHDEFYEKMPTFYDEYKSKTYSNFYLPKNIIVLCSAKTYSSGYTMMKVLNELGATVIGAPSSQNENAPGWILNFELKNSETRGWVACKYYASFSDRIVDEVYQVDNELTYDKLKEYNFDPNSEILFALDLLNDEPAE
ncbi:MAG: hypothetical protein AMJ46_09855 [Latescibacteria bacterium DG_63]|nr:MAG: hypothetical protein AMJ46_09855 [Latescibacteria bacterium DG_63]